MVEIGLTSIKKNFGFKNVLDGFDLEVQSGEKIGLIGPNGCGKSTLFRLIMKEEIPDSGRIHIRKGSSVKMLSQIPPKVEDHVTVLDILMDNFQEVFQIERELRKLEKEMSACGEEELEKILKRYGRLQEQYAEMDGYNVDAKIQEICNRFKIDDDLMLSEYNTLSGGEKTMIHFASIMLTSPDVLLLDEPTNNLDIERLEWLEKFLSNYNGTVIMSSHDRYFLDKVASKIVLIDRGKAEIFFGNYSYYLEENERRVLAEFEQYKDQQKMIEAMKRKIKQLQEFGRLAFPGGESFFKRAASIQKRLDKLELLDRPETKKELPLNFQMSDRSGKKVLVAKNYSLDIGNKELLKNVSFQLNFHDKVCLMGKNGCGKSTFIKKIVELEEDSGDSLKVGSNVQIGYIPQVIQFEDENATVLEVARKSFNGSETYLRASLAKFMFHGENVFKRVGSLSGGEKVRLKLFELIQKNVNFLIMDEPTNHIDIDTKEVLENALKDYSGTILFVSHDRFFINQLAEKVFYIQDKKIIESIGNYDDYLEYREKVFVKGTKRR